MTQKHRASWGRSEIVTARHTRHLMQGEPEATQ